jgi:hypothetical protein
LFGIYQKDGRPLEKILLGTGEKSERTWYAGGSGRGLEPGEREPESGQIYQILCR